jgi:hypothetical protein
MWSETFGRYAGSNGGNDRSWATRHSTSQVSKANDEASVSAAVSSTRSTSEASEPTIERCPATVMSTAKAR